MYLMMNFYSEKRYGKFSEHHSQALLMTQVFSFFDSKAGESSTCKLSNMLVQVELTLNEYHNIHMYLFSCFQNGAVEHGAMANTAWFLNHSKATISLIWECWCTHAKSNLRQFPNYVFGQTWNGHQKMYNCTVVWEVLQQLKFLQRKQFKKFQNTQAYVTTQFTAWSRGKVFGTSSQQIEAQVDRGEQVDKECVLFECKRSQDRFLHLPRFY